MNWTRHLLIVSCILMAGCGAPTRTPITNQDPRWEDDSKPLETVFQWIGRKQGVAYLLDPRLDEVRVVFARPPGTADEMLHHLIDLYRLEIKPSPDRRMVVTPLEPPAFYEQFSDPPLKPGELRIRL